MTGIQSRRVSADDGFTSDIACHAVAECLDNSKYVADQIDLVICCHIGRDEQPNSAALEPGTAMYSNGDFNFPTRSLSILRTPVPACLPVSALPNRTSGQALPVVHRGQRGTHLARADDSTTGNLGIHRSTDCRFNLGGCRCSHCPRGRVKQRGWLSGFGDVHAVKILLDVHRSTDRIRAHGGPILIVPDPIKHTSIAINNSVVHSRLVLDRSSWEPEEIRWVIMHQTSERSLLDGASHQRGVSAKNLHEGKHDQQFEHAG